MMRSKVAGAQRWVVKIGSALLTADGKGLDRAAMGVWVEQMVALHEAGVELVLVSSGAVAAGMSRLGWTVRPSAMHELQAAAAIGQMGLVQAWESSFAEHGRHTAQILLTHDDLSDRKRYLNARSTLRALVELKVIPVINENDTVVTDEIKFGDNDRLAARVATMASADLLILLSDIDGLYDAPPGANPNAKLIPIVESVTSEIEGMAGAAESELSRGGMFTKIEAAKIATSAGTHMLIASGKIEHPLRAIADGGRCTWFLTPANPVTARKRWIAGSLEPKGTLTIDAGAVAALRAGKSLLPAGVIRIDGQFARGDAVVVRGPDTHEIGRGLVAYDAEDAEKIKGRSSPDVMTILGISGRAEMIHRDDLVVGPSGGFSAS
ncbi:MAG TPA: glutamate 5-kinase [Pseudomonas sp.]|nr:glutamate 5-kinase [Pseudomonas sp.]